MAQYQIDFEIPLRKILRRISPQQESSQVQKSNQVNLFGEGMVNLLISMGAEVEKNTAAQWQQSHTIEELY